LKLSLKISRTHSPLFRANVLTHTLLPYRTATDKKLLRAVEGTKISVYIPTVWLQNQTSSVHLLCLTPPLVFHKQIIEQIE